MQIPINITFRDLPVSEALKADIEDKAAKLEQFVEQIISCHVVVELHHKHHHKGNLYQVRIDLTVPGSEIVVSRENNLNHAYEDPYVAVRDAFNAARNQLQAYQDKLKKHVKSHEAPSHGVVARVFEDGFGFIETTDQREIYFHRNSVVNSKFDRLKAGDSVRFVEVAGEQGPQASTVKLEGKHHIVSR